MNYISRNFGVKSKPTFSKYKKSKEKNPGTNKKQQQIIVNFNTQINIIGRQIFSMDNLGCACEPQKQWKSKCQKHRETSIEKQK